MEESKTGQPSGHEGSLPIRLYSLRIATKWSAMGEKKKQNPNFSSASLLLLHVHIAGVEPTEPGHAGSPVSCRFHPGFLASFHLVKGISFKYFEGAYLCSAQLDLACLCSISVSVHC